MSKKSISVIMAAFNGENYILGQLNSIRFQTKRPDEVIIIDDSSTDGTDKLVSEYITKYNLSNWKLIINEKNVGWRRNFTNAIRVASGDIIFLADQDDYWYETKIEKMYDAMEKNPLITLLSCGFKVKYLDTGQIKVKPYTKRKSLIYKLDLNNNTINVLRPGCTYAFDKSLIKKYDAIWTDDEAHDAILWSIALLLDGLYLMDSTLMIQHRHKGNCTPSNKKISNVRIGILKARSLRTARLISKLELTDIQKVKWLEEYLKVMNSRVKFIESRDIIQFFKLAFKLNYFPKFSSLLGDLLASITQLN